MRETFLPGFYVMLSLLILTVILSFLGIIVQYTTWGDIKDKNVNI